jgi:hypothetical protein
MFGSALLRSAKTRSALFALEGVGEHVRVQVSRNRYSVVKSRRASANGKKHFPAGSALAE